MYICSTKKEERKLNTGIIAPFVEDKKVFILSLASIVLIFLSLYNSIFGIAAFVLDIYAVFTLKPEKTIILLSSLIPWAYIYKISILPTSLFSILVFATALRFLHEIKKINTYFIVLLGIFVLNVVLHFSMNDKSILLMFIKLIVNLFLLYEICIIHKSENFTAVLVFFVFSVLLSSIVAISIPNRELFANRIRQEGTFVEFQYERFKGLQNDPNYYNSSLIICLLFLCYLFIQRKARLSFFVLSFACIYFGVLTYSKSFFIMLLMWIGVVIYYSLSKKRYSLSLFLLGIGIVGIELLFSGRIQTITILLSRFSDSSDVTTGRVDTWKMFIQHFTENPTVLLFGNGFESIVLNLHASHNSYIDMIYYFGFAGSIIFALIVRVCFQQRTGYNREPFAYIFMSFVFTIYFFLSGITMCELPFFLFFIFLFLHNSDNKQNDNEYLIVHDRTFKSKYIRDN